VDPVPNPLLLSKSGSAGNRSRDVTFLFNTEPKRKVLKRKVTSLSFRSTDIFLLQNFKIIFDVSSSEFI
jgi:hypothetical protein